MLLPHYVSRMTEGIYFLLFVHFSYFKYL
eukprot:UN05771